MDLTLNIIPAPLPDICESEHERPAPITDTDGGHPRLSQKSKVAIIKVPCNSPSEQIPVSGNTDIKTEHEVAATRKPVSSSFENLADAHVSPCNPVFVRGKGPSTSRKTTTPLASSNRPPLSPQFSTPPKHTLKSKKNGTQSRQKRSIIIPSNSEVSSYASHSSPSNRLGVPRTPNQCPTSSTPRKNTTSDKAAETVRVTEWAMSLVRSAEKRVRQQERAVYEKEIFELRMRKWEAEMKIQKLEENAANSKKREENQREKECFKRIISWKGDVSRTGRCKNMMRDAYQQCRRGLAVALE